MIESAAEIKVERDELNGFMDGLKKEAEKIGWRL